MTSENAEEPTPVGRRREPIAIVGMACRFPGEARDPDAFWELLCGGRDAIREVPRDRWDLRRYYDVDPKKAGKFNCREGGFLTDPIDQFDPLFFGISPREAACMDPQQRLLLETTWEVFEDAGLTEEQLDGSRTGVFVGGFCMDHELIHGHPLNRDFADSQMATGSSKTMLSARLSHVFNLRGPSVALDTACSSSLVATHFACQSLLNGECDMAIAGGINLLLDPSRSMAMTRGGFLAADGRCRAFDAKASGYVRSEGAGVILLKPLQQALHDGDSIYALVMASAVNQDGHTPGITLPDAGAQMDLIAEVHRRAGIEPGEVQYIEAHGTGTQAGDLVEAKAIHGALSRGRDPERQCLVGSVKTNVGHMEAAAGIGGLMKAALILKHGLVPPNLHFEQPNPNIPFDELCFRVPTEVERFPSWGDQRYAGVNSFGYGGTNAHVLLCAAPPVLEEPTGPEGPTELHGEERVETETGPVLIPLSARGEAALGAVAECYEKHLEAHPEATPGDYANAAALLRTHHSYRACVVAETREEWAAGLEALQQEQPQEGVVRGRVIAKAEPEVAFVYTGMGPQWWAMGRELMEHERACRDAIEEVDSLFSKLSGWSLVEELLADEAVSRMTRTDVAQPANFALQMGLTALWRAWGIEPEAVIGHSAGEVAAACVSGALSLEDAVYVIHHRSRLQQKAAGRGGMLAVAMRAEEAERLVEDYEGVSIAAFNSPSLLTLSGASEPLRALGERLEADQVFHRFLKVAVAYHSPQMDFLESEVKEALSGITPRLAQIPLHSTVTGLRARGDDWDADYWWRNIREPVRFVQGIQSLLAESYDAVLEIGPHPDLSNGIRECQIESGGEAAVLPSLRRQKPERRRMLETLGALHVLGVPVDWSRVAPRSARRLRLPTYPFQRESYWQEVEATRRERVGGTGHVFLDQRLETPEPVYEMDLTEGFLPHMNDHRVDGAVVFPGGGYLEAGLALNHHENEAEACVLEEVHFHSPLILDAASSQVLRLAMDADRRRFAIYSRTRGATDSWKEHATGRLAGLEPGHASRTVDVEALAERIGTLEAPDALYDTLTQMGLSYGPHFRRIRRIATSDDEVLAEISPPEGDLADDPAVIHTTVLDASFQALVALLRASDDPMRPFVPVSVGRLRFFEKPQGTIWSHGRGRMRAGRFVVGDITLVDERGRICAEIEGVHCRQVPGSERKSLLPAELHYRLHWETAEAPARSDEGEGTWLVVGSAEDGAEELVGLLREAGRPAVWRPTRGERLVDEAERETLAVVLYLAGRAQAPEADRVSRECAELLQLVQALTDGERAWHGRLGVVTHGAQSVVGGECSRDPAGAALWGLARVIRLEHPEMACRSVDLPAAAGATDPAEWARMVACVTGDTDETEWALRGEHHFVHRLGHGEAKGSVSDVREELRGSEHAWCLDVASPGLLDSLHYRENELPEPGHDEVAVEVHATGLNFKDTLKALDRLSPEVIAGTYSEDRLGLECSGTVTAVGDGVAGLAPGDEVVVGIARNALGSHVVVPRDFVLPRPTRLTLDEAPVLLGFFTAWLGLVDVARLRKGERVLIHSATGGVGLAAIQIARWLGAEVVATAGSEAKRDYLRALGVEHVMNSRDLSFAEEIRTTVGAVDVVFNSLAGEALYQSIELLEPYGRFVEIGKGEILKDAGLPMSVFNRNVSFTAIDLDRIAKERPEEIGRLLREVAAGFEDGRFQPIPVEIFEAAEAEEAFRLLASTRHVGKVVVRMKGETVPVRVAHEVRGGLREDGTYLVTGGNAGFGLEVGKWLAKRGAGHVVLASRSGGDTSESDHASDAGSAIAELRASGMRVSSVSLDVTDERQVARFMESLTERGEVLRGIVHGAMVLDDDWLRNLDAARFERVLAPKVAGALNLHAHAASPELDFFVSFSSIASLFGNAGQGAYAAANAFLDSFSSFQRAEGVPGTSINWGVLSDAGVVARNPEVARSFVDAGIRGIPAVSALSALEALLQDRPDQAAVVDVDWLRLQTARPSLAFSPIIRDLVTTGSAEARQGLQVAESEIQRELAELAPDKREERMVRFLAEELARILRLPVEKIDPRADVNDLGLDSLMAMELVTVVERELALRLSTMELMSGASIETFSRKLTAMAFPEERA